MAESPWTELKMERLREYWTQGMPTREIAETLGFSKSGIIGKAKRMRLPDHPAACRYVVAADGKRKLARSASSFWTEEKVRELRRIAEQGLTAAEIASRIGAKSKGVIYSIAHRRGIPLLGTANTPPKAAAFGAAPELEAAPLPAPDEALPESRLLSLFDLKRVGMCRWPIGDVGKPGFAFCAADCAPSRSYCETHHRLSRGNGTPGERNAHVLTAKAVA